MSVKQLDQGYKESAVIIVDPQNDFCPGGSLEVKDGDKIMSVANNWIDAARNRRVPVLISRDWHPAETAHFQSGGGTWPAHCVQNTDGASFHKALKIPYDAFIITKGTGPDEDGTSYSAFRGKIDRLGDWRDGMSPADFLKRIGVTRIYVMGLATDYCVKETVLDGLKEGFEVYVVEEGCRAVNLDPTDGRKALELMQKSGAKIISNA